MHFDLAAHTIYLVRSGSHAYGTNIETSDLDQKGIAVPPKSHLLGFAYPFEQAESRSPDSVIFGIQKFFKLAADCNPNIIELLYTDPRDYLMQPHRAMQKVLDSRELFLSKKAKFTFSGYAISQLKRIRTHRKWLLDPPRNKPERRDFGLPEKGIGASQLGAAEALQQEGVDLAPQFLEVLQREHAYRDAARHWDQYLNWKQTRNPKRAALEEKHGFDCYSADTEFLTESGWKLFDDIDGSTKLATLNQRSHGIEYQLPYERHDAKYTGNMYMVSGQHADIRVSGNHRMYVCPYSRTLGRSSAWTFSRANRLPDTFDVVTRVDPKKRQYKNDRPCGIDLRFYLKLMGWYVSEGSVARRLKDGSASVLSISQLMDGRVHWPMSRAISDYADQGVKINKYSHYRASANRTEITWTISNRAIAKRMAEECGDYSYNKRLPRWVFGLSARMKRMLLEALHQGDGTDKPPGSSEKHSKRRIYYTCSKQLADDVQELAFLAGLETSLWGPYETSEGHRRAMYHVYISHSADKTRRLMRNANVCVESVKDERIVCFSVPNEILITRRNGCIAVQGNTKHGMHLVRLLRMGEEILSGKGVIVRRPDAEELLAIRRGAWSYDVLLEWATQKEAELDILYYSSKLPKSPDLKTLNDLCAESTLQALSQ